MPLYKLSIIIPCYNEQDSIESTLDHLSRIFKGIDDIEVIVIDDCSNDNTPEILAKTIPRYEQMNPTVLRNQENRGYGASLKRGINRAVGEIIAITDADGTYPNDQIPELIKSLDNADMVVGARTLQNEVNYPFIRKIPKYFLNKYCQWITKQKIPDMNSGLRVFRRKLVKKYLNLMPDGFSFTTTITIALMTNNYEVTYIPISYSKRIGTSKIHPIYDPIRFIQLIFRTGIYFAPVRTFAPILLALCISLLTSFSIDIYRENIGELSLSLLAIFINSSFFVLLADMIDKRT